MFSLYFSFLAGLKLLHLLNRRSGFWPRRLSSGAPKKLSSQSRGRGMPFMAFHFFFFCLQLGFFSEKAPATLTLCKASDEHKVEGDYWLLSSDAVPLCRLGVHLFFLLHHQYFLSFLLPLYPSSFTTSSFSPSEGDKLPLAFCSVEKALVLFFSSDVWKPESVFWCNIHRWRLTALLPPDPSTLREGLCSGASVNQVWVECHLNQNVPQIQMISTDFHNDLEMEFNPLLIIHCGALLVQPEVGSADWLLRAVI